MARFLRLAVEHALAGHAGDLKEYLIGVEVFDRKASYDPRVDPIVRVEARRLRAKLKAYYEGDGSADPVLIEFLSGTYAPRLTTRDSPAPAHPPVHGTTVAVLPFADLGLKPQNQYFSDGLTEELIHALTKVPRLRVVAWNTAAQLRDRQDDVRSLREQLQVDAVLTGSVRIAGGSLRVRAQLIDTASGVYLWSETFDRHMQDVFSIQEEIALAIVRTLRVQLTGEGESPVLARGRSTIGAYDYYLKGRYYWHRRSPEDLRRSVEYFEAAIAADHTYAPALAGLADAFTLLVDYGLLHPAEGMPKAKAAAERAIELDPGQAEAYASLALIRSLYDWEWEEALGLYRRAIELNPGYATAHNWLGLDWYALNGRFDKAMAHMEIALQLDPLSGIIREGAAFVHFLAGRQQEAVRGYLGIIQDDPTFYKAYTSLGRAYAHEGKYLDAIRMLEKGRTLAGNVPNILAAIGQVYACGGQQERAREILGELEQMRAQSHVPSTAFAVIHLGLGETARALDWLEIACRQHESPLTSIKVHPIYAALRGEPRFQEILRQLRFAG
ncbi:MAG: Tetratricopeptide 4 [Candidatus Solibacter sp.]|nr:Tetratricopeptide 4 [Candidatus Solibacter sp.]